MTVFDHYLEIQKLLSKSSNIALVPTMGALHDGHLALISHAKSIASQVVVSIFINPLQFGVNEDFARYPRTLTEDINKLKNIGVTAIYTPTVDVMYPHWPTLTIISNHKMGNILCGAHRGGHFDGVLTVVLKLYQQINPNIIVLGEKDFQQYIIIKTMMNDLNVPVEIIAAPTIRHENGLAMSSRNQYLSENQLDIAKNIHKILNWAKDMINTGASDIDNTIITAKQMLLDAGFTSVDYFTALHHETLTPIINNQNGGRLFVAARLDNVRLIDNLALL